MIIKIDGRPVPAKRTTQRAKFTKSYQKYSAYKEHVRWCAINQGHDFTFGDKLLEVVVFVNLFGGGKYNMGNDGDIDNYIKSALDSLNGVVFDDDRQVRKVHGIKSSVETKAKESMIIEVREVAHEEI